MFEQVLAYIQNFAGSHGSWGVFWASVIEEVVAPIPSSLVLLSAGHGLMNGFEVSFLNFLRLLLVVAVPAGIGLTLGSLLFYFFGLYLGKPFVEKWGKYFGLGLKDLQKAEKYFERGNTDEVILVVSRCFPLVPNAAISLLCGIVGMKTSKYIILTFFGSVFRGVLMGAVGWQAGVLYTKHLKNFEYTEEFFTVFVLLTVFVWLVYKNRHKFKKS